MYLNWEAFALWCCSSICCFSGIFNAFKTWLNLARQSPGWTDAFQITQCELSQEPSLQAQHIAVFK